MSRPRLVGGLAESCTGAPEEGKRVLEIGFASGPQLSGGVCHPAHPLEMDEYRKRLILTVARALPFYEDLCLAPGLILR